MEFILNLFASSEVRTQVMKLIKERLQEAEIDFKFGVSEIREQLQSDIETARVNAEEKTRDLTKKLVKDVIGDLVK